MKWCWTCQLCRSNFNIISKVILLKKKAPLSRCRPTGRAGVIVAPTAWGWRHACSLHWWDRHQVERNESPQPQAMVHPVDNAKRSILASTSCSGEVVREDCSKTRPGVQTEGARQRCAESNCNFSNCNCNYIFSNCNCYSVACLKMLL